MDTSQRTSQANNDVRYEEQDVRFKPLVVSATGLLVLLIVVAAGVAGVFRLFAARTDRTPAIPTVVGNGSARELQELRQREDERLNRYEWVSREHGIVRIPIERAMELALDEAKSTQ